MYPVKAGARAAANHLAADLGPDLPAEVENAIHASISADQPQRYFDPISLGGLIVSIATLAWTVYAGLRPEKTAETKTEVITKVTIEMQENDNLYAVDLNKVIDVVVTEVIKAADDDGQD